MFFFYVQKVKMSLVLVDFSPTTIDQDEFRRACIGALEVWLISPEEPPHMIPFLPNTRVSTCQAIPETGYICGLIEAVRKSPVPPILSSMMVSAEIPIIVYTNNLETRRAAIKYRKVTCFPDSVPDNSDDDDSDDDSDDDDSDDTSSVTSSSEFM